MSTRTISPDVANARARLSGLSRYRDPADPEIASAKRNLTAATIEQYIERVVSNAPPLTSDQRSRLAALLVGDAA